MLDRAIVNYQLLIEYVGPGEQTARPYIFRLFILPQ